MPRYNPAQIEPKWQAYWEKHQCFKTPEMPGEKKKYVLDMFPYPSGNGLHVGHPEGYTATDILSRYWRMNGYSVLHPMGFDAFGLPAEEYAIKTNTPPRESTEANIANFTRQLKMLGFSYDWERSLSTTDVDYFKWTQWIFLVLFDTWYDTTQSRGRPISELPIPEEVAAEGEAAVSAFRDQHRLAYQSDALVNWCAGLGTVLANEEVVNGVSERGGHPVTRMPLRQWMLRITAYADRLGDDLQQVDWPEGIKNQQREWIGRSEGAEVDFFVGPAQQYSDWQQSRKTRGFPVRPDDQVLRIYTTRPDTLYGATYMVIAPEHPLVETLTSEDQQSAVRQYCEAAAAKSDRERQEDKKTKSGVFSGSYAINPATDQPIPIWIADYVLIGYGTGAIMAVPAHDDRDFEFAQQFALPVVAVLDPDSEVDAETRVQILAGEACYTGPGCSINSGPLDGMATDQAKQTITQSLAVAGIGQSAVNYKLRDWLFSRQRFWGEPFPILHEVDENRKPTGVVRALEPEDLPVDLPQLEDYKPHGRPEPPLAKADDQWLYVERDGKLYRRETNTMPQWAGSCWYYLRYIDNKNDQLGWDAAKESAWMPVDLYVGGAEHAVLHLLYARFWHKVLFDRGYVSTPEPFQRLINQGMILGEAQYFATPEDFAALASELRDRDYLGVVDTESDPPMVNLRKRDPAVESDQPVDHPGISEADTDKKKGVTYLAGTSLVLKSKADKMSKSRGNVINPDVIVDQYGADSLRLYEMFMGPLQATKPWSMSGVGGVRNFLDRAWRLIIDDKSEELSLNAAVGDYSLTDELNRLRHRTVKSVTQDIDGLSFNTAIARMMEFVNAFTKESKRPISAMKDFVILLSPFAPHIAEEMWEALGDPVPLTSQSWPMFDESLTVDSVIEIPVQIKGKVRGKIQVPADASKEQMLEAAKSDPKIAEQLADVTIVKEIVVPGRLVNLVTR